METEEKSVNRTSITVAIIILLAALIVAVGASFIWLGWWSHRVEGPTSPEVNNGQEQVAMRNYQNQRLGIVFSYPQVWGDVKESAEKGCFYEGPKDDPRCENVVLKFSNNNLAEITSAGRSFVLYPNPREGLLSDTLFIKNQIDIDTFCQGKDSALCRVYKNPQGIIVAKYAMPAQCNDLNGCVPATTYYYMKLNQNDYPGLSFMADAALEKDMDKVVESLKFQ